MYYVHFIDNNYYIDRNEGLDDDVVYQSENKLDCDNFINIQLNSKNGFYPEP